MARGHRGALPTVLRHLAFVGLEHKDQRTSSPIRRAANQIADHAEDVIEFARHPATVDQAARVSLPHRTTRVRAHQGEPCQRCDSMLEAVFYDLDVMTDCPPWRTDGRILEGRRARGQIGHVVRDLTFITFVLCARLGSARTV
jgi:hypothetical protein